MGHQGVNRDLWRNAESEEGQQGAGEQLSYGPMTSQGKIETVLQISRFFANTIAGRPIILPFSR